jgi:hypothetical protein
MRTETMPGALGPDAGHREADGPAEVDRPVDEAVGARPVGRRHHVGHRRLGGRAVDVAEEGRAEGQAGEPGGVAHEAEGGHAGAAGDEAEEHGGAAAHPIGERAAQRAGQEQAEPVERHHAAGLVGGEAAVVHQVERQEGDDEAGEAVHQHPGPEGPEHRRQAAGRGAEAGGDEAHGEAPNTIRAGGAPLGGGACASARERGEHQARDAAEVGRIAGEEGGAGGEADAGDEEVGVGDGMSLATEQARDGRGDLGGAGRDRQDLDSAERLAQPLQLLDGGARPPRQLEQVDAGGGQLAPLDQAAQPAPRGLPLPVEGVDEDVGVTSAGVKESSAASARRTRSASSRAGRRAVTARRRSQVESGTPSAAALAVAMASSAPERRTLMTWSRAAMPRLWPSEGHGATAPGSVERTGSLD